MGSLIENNTALSTTKVSLQSDVQYLTFVLGGEIFALSIQHIREIIQFGDLTEVPMMPKFVRGVINLRGKVVPVVDLSLRFGNQLTAVARRTSIVLVEIKLEEENETQAIGIMVDAVNEVVEINQSDIEPAPAFGSKIRPDFISGMAKLNGKFIAVLHLEMVLSIEEITELSEQIASSTSSQHYFATQSGVTAKQERAQIGMS